MNGFLGNFLMGVGGVLLFVLLAHVLNRPFRRETVAPKMDDRLTGAEKDRARALGVEVGVAIGWRHHDFQAKISGYYNTVALGTTPEDAVRRVLANYDDRQRFQTDIRRFWEDS